MTAAAKGAVVLGWSPLLLPLLSTELPATAAVDDMSLEVRVYYDTKQQLSLPAHTATMVM